MINWRHAMCDAVLLNDAAPRSPRLPGTASPRRLARARRCLDIRSSSDLTSGGDLSKAHPNYQTSTRGQAMQRVVTRGPRSEGGARCCPRFAGAKRRRGWPGPRGTRAGQRYPCPPRALSRRSAIPIPARSPNPGRRRSSRATRNRMGTSVLPVAVPNARRQQYAQQGRRIHSAAPARRCRHRPAVSAGKPVRRGSGSGPDPRSYPGGP